MTDAVIHGKLEFLELLSEYQNEGLTSTEIHEVYWGNDFSQEAISNALRRLKYQGSAYRRKEGRRWRYFINEQGLRKLDFLANKKLLTDSYAEPEEELEEELEDELDEYEDEEKTEEELEAEIAELEEELANL